MSVLGLVLEIILAMAIGAAIGWIVGDVVGWFIWGRETYSSPWTRRKKDKP